MKYVKLAVSLMFVVTTFSASAKQPTAPTLQQGQSIYGFLDANPNVQRNWITANDRKRAALSHYATTCKVANKNCNRLKSFDPKARVAPRSTQPKVK